LLINALASVLAEISKITLQLIFNQAIFIICLDENEQIYSLKGAGSVGE